MGGGGEKHEVCSGRNERIGAAQWTGIGGGCGIIREFNLGFWVVGSGWVVQGGANVARATNVWLMDAEWDPGPVICAKWIKAPLPV